MKALLVLACLIVGCLSPAPAYSQSAFTAAQTNAVQLSRIFTPRSLIYISGQPVSVTGRIESELYGCCDDVACTTCEDEYILLNRGIRHNGKTLSKLMVVYLDGNYGKDLYEFHDKTVAINGVLHPHSQHGAYLEIVTITPK